MELLVRQTQNHIEGDAYPPSLSKPAFAFIMHQCSKNVLFGEKSIHTKIPQKIPLLLP
jgi:hypothetical protein